MRGPREYFRGLHKCAPLPLATCTIYKRKWTPVRGSLPGEGRRGRPANVRVPRRPPRPCARRARLSPRLSGRRRDAVICPVATRRGLRQTRRLPYPSCACAAPPRPDRRTCFPRFLYGEVHPRIRRDRRTCVSVPRRACPVRCARRVRSSPRLAPADRARVSPRLSSRRRDAVICPAATPAGPRLTYRPPAAIMVLAPRRGRRRVSGRDAPRGVPRHTTRTRRD